MTQTRLDGVGCYNPASERDHAMWAKLQDFCASEPRAFERDPETGHVTGSAFVLSPDLSAVLLTHHAKLNRWLQLGGHCDGIADVPFVALKEAYEESGLSRITPIGAEVFDVDVHEIPANAKEPAHLHYDVRFLFRAEGRDFKVSDESHDLAWVPIAELEQMSDAPSVLVLRDKLARFLSGGA
ncbi:NUDIX hydrolase [Epibacterium sp. SM1979]|uniref:NUDIX hydrolase n=1 Tax=Tritonibacter litoralis TaxID=2662264 RepID=A0A843YC31_9RHOB|nr:NUDIX hydrolase [Tritonibacter litoralis]MQQ06882.1 NUDIX hydrolase [Tritonibacter litoralis]